MTLSTRRPAGTSPRGRGDGGTSILEFTLVAILLFTLIFGIINFGLILAFKQDMTRAAAEGARAGAVAFPSSTALADATAATDEAVKAFSDRFKTNGCLTTGLTCTLVRADCGTAAGVDPAVPDCVSVSLSYDYDANPLIGALPMIEPFLPNTITAKSDARVNE